MYHSNPSVINCYHFLWAELWTVQAVKSGSCAGTYVLTQLYLWEESGFQGDACLANKMS